jgi:hypothetical protein
MTTPPLIGTKTEHIRTGLHARPRSIEHARWYCSICSICSIGEDSLTGQKGTRGHNPTCGRVITHGRVGTGRYGRNGRYGSPSTPGRRRKRDNVDRSTRAGKSAKFGQFGQVYTRGDGASLTLLKMLTDVNSSRNNWTVLDRSTRAHTGALYTPARILQTIDTLSYRQSLTKNRTHPDRSTRAGRDTPAPLPRLSNHPSDSGHTGGDGRADILPYRRISPHGNKAPSPHLSKCYGFLTQPLPQGTLRRGKITCKNVNIF